MQLDTTQPFAARVARRLEREAIIWLTTVDASGTPQPRPVWFLWDGADALLIYSMVDSHKNRHIADNPSVALHFNGDRNGGDIVVFTGEARIDAAAPPPVDNPDYVAKYHDGLLRIGMTPESFADKYATAVRVTLTGLRGH